MRRPRDLKAFLCLIALAATLVLLHGVLNACAVELRLNSHADQYLGARQSLGARNTAAGESSEQEDAEDENKSHEGDVADEGSSVVSFVEAELEAVRGS